MGFFCDGRASLVVGTHTHVPTGDHRVLQGGTAFMTDIGMCGDYDTVIGMDRDEPLSRFLTGIPSGRYEPADGPGSLSGVAVETDDKTGLALKVAPVRLGGRLDEAVPAFWAILTPGFEILNLRFINHPLSRLLQDHDHGRPFPIQEHHAPQGPAGRDEVQAVRQARARNHRGGQAGHAGPGDEPAPARRDHGRPRREHAQGQYRARHQEGRRQRRARTTTRFATRATARAASPSSSRS